MPRFLTGDELGSIKSVSYDPDASTNNLLLKILHDGTSTGRTRGVQKLAMSRSDPAQVRVSLTPTSRTATNNVSGQVGFGTRRRHPLSRIINWRGRSGATSRMEGNEIQSGPVFRRSGVDTKVSGKRVKLVEELLIRTSSKVLYTHVPLMAHFE